MRHFVSFALLACLLAPAAAQRPGAAPDVLLKLLQQYDKDQDGKVQRGEYPRTAAAFANLDRDKNGVLDGADFAMAPVRPKRGEGRPAKGEVEKVPKVGDMAPDFELPMLGMKDTTIKLSSFRGSKPVALIFGSYT